MGELLRIEFGASALDQGEKMHILDPEQQNTSEYGHKLESVVVADLASDPGEGYTAACSQADIDLVKAWLQGRRF